MQNALRRIWDTLTHKQRQHRSELDLPKSLADMKAFGYSVAAGDEVTGLDLQLPPSFFVIGAPRCGSTSFCKTLSRNPNISFSKPKETHFLLRPSEYPGAAEWRRVYVGRYHPNLNATHQALGDGSVSYIYAPDAIQRALDFDSRAKFIALVRNPVDMIQSFHLRLRYSLDEDVEDFEQAWALRESRAQGRNIPKRCRDPRMLQYGEIGKHSVHLQRVFAVAGHERCLVLLFDDLLQTPRATYEKVLNFIGVDDDGQTEFVRKRETMGFKSSWLQQFVMNPPAWVLRLVESVDIRKISRLKRMRKSLKKFNNRPAERPPLSPEMRETLRSHFAEDVRALSVLLGRDLSHW